jgi:membrane fusion protein (multidrug efflux system)
MIGPKHFLIFSLLLCSMNLTAAGADAPVSTNSVANNTSTSQVILSPKRTAVLSSQIAGTIKAIPVKEGESFAEGTPLVVFDCTIYQADYDKANAQLTSKKSAYASNSQLARVKAISNAELAQSKADVLSLDADVKIKQYTVGYCTVTAPFAGTMVNRKVHEFETVRQGQELVEILDNSDLNIELIVPSAWLSWLNINTPFDLFIQETQKDYPAHVTKILPQVDSVSQSIRVFGQLDNPNKDLVGGMSGKASFTPESKEIQ